ncbi:MAG: hypothetical protein CMJ31_06400 [Phycisphaerae bacterium]|nr:hypothetical protein [Phycisphaerae bacterium]
MQTGRHIGAIGAIAAIAVSAPAGVVTDSSTMIMDNAIGFETLALNTPITSLDFGDGLVANVTAGSGAINRVFNRHDGHGAVSYEGEMAWKIANGPFTFDFGASQVDTFGFWYSDLEWADLHISFDGAPAVVLSDNNSRNPKFWAFEADPGESFSNVTITFTGHNDGVGIDGIFAAAVPPPGAAAVMGVAGALTFSRRRRG